MSKLIEKTSDFFKEIVLITISAVVVCLYPVLLLVYCPLFIHRCLVQLMVRSDPRMGKILSGLESLFAASADPVTGVPTSVFLPCFPFASTIDMNHIKRTFEEKVVNAHDSNGKLKYPELSQRIVQKYGYFVMQNVDNFRIENHVKFLNQDNPNKLVKKSDLHDVLQKLTNLAFDQSQSPWEFIVIPNFVDEKYPAVKSLGILRFDHSLSDGFSALAMIGLTAKTPFKHYIDGSQTKKKGILETVYHFLDMLLTTPYHVLKVMHFSDDENEWAKIAKTNCEGRVFLKESTPINISDLTEIKEQFKVGMSSIITAAVAEGIAKTMKRRNVSVSKFNLTLPWPLPGHPAYLTNHWSIVKLPVVLGNNDPIQTLKNVDASFARVKSSPSALAFSYVTSLMGTLPTCIIPKSSNIVSSTGLLSNFPISPTSIDFFGYHVPYMVCGGTPAKGYAAAAICLYYNQHFIVSAGGDACVFKDDDSVFLMSSFENTLQEFKSKAKRKIK